MPSPLTWWAVVSSWDGTACWECRGDHGQAWEVVAAPTAEEAVALVRRGHPACGEFGEEVTFRVFRLASTPAPNMKRTQRYRPDGFGPRPMVETVVVEPAQGGPVWR